MKSLSVGAILAILTGLSLTNLRAPLDLALLVYGLPALVFLVILASILRTIKLARKREP